MVTSKLPLDRKGTEVDRVGSAGCPGQNEIEGYFYGYLSPLRIRLVKYHVEKCAQCQKRLEEIERFDDLLSNIPLEEPPPELCSRIIESVQNEQSAKDAKWRQLLRPLLGEDVFSVRVRWAASIVLLLLNFLFYRRFSLSGGLLGPKTYILGWADLRFIYDQLVSGDLWANLKAVLVALRADGLFALEIITDVLPGWFPNVLILAGVVVVVWVAHLVVCRSEVRRT